MIGILNHVDAFCRENGIKYSLGYGSLIGAIRHHGFIPWDDDIDIIMTREDYDRFIELHNLNTYEQGRYRVRMGQEIANHLHAMVSDEETKVLFPEGSTDNKFYHGGVWVDLFPLDNCSDENNYDFKWNRINKMRRLQMFAEMGALPGGSFFKRMLVNLLHLLLYPFSSSIGKRLNKMMKDENACETDYFVSFSVWYWKQKLIPKELFDEYVDVEFEGRMYFALSGYDRYLRDLYSDYMKFPPESQRVPKHNYKAFTSINVVQ